jgi:hypothetical protein
MSIVPNCVAKRKLGWNAFHAAMPRSLLAFVSSIVPFGTSSSSEQSNWLPRLPRLQQSDGGPVISGGARVTWQRRGS